MGLVTGFAIIAQKTRRGFRQAFYTVTKYYPRPLPRTETEYLAMCHILMQFFGLEDDPSVWTTVSGQITSVPAVKMRKSYGSISNAAKRLRVNYIAHQHKLVAMKALEDRINQAALKMVENDEPENSGAV